MVQINSAETCTPAPLGVHIQGDLLVPVPEEDTPSILQQEQDLQAAKTDQELQNVVSVRTAGASAAVRASRIQQRVDIISNYCLSKEEEEEEEEEEEGQGRDLESQQTADTGGTFMQYDNRGRPITKNLRLPDGTPHCLGAIAVDGPGFDTSAHCILAESDDDDDDDASRQDHQESIRDGESNNQRLSNTKLLIGGTILLVVTATIIVVAALVLAGNPNRSSGTNPDFTPDDELDPWKEVSLEEDNLPAPPELIMLDLPDSTLKAISEFRTPQAIAYDWLANDPNLGNYTDWRRKQRFALATIAFSAIRFEHAHDWYQSHECEWSSTFEDCCNDKGRVIKLKLRLGGIFPWGEFVNLNLDLIPPEVILFLPDLQELDAVDRSTSSFSATEEVSSAVIPTAVLQLTNLRILRVISPHVPEAFKLDGTLPADLPSKLPLLELLDLSYNAFTGSIPSQYSSLQNLQVLRLSHNRLNGTIPMDFGQDNLQNLTIFDVNSNPDLAAQVPSGFCLDDGGGPQLEYFKTDWCDNKLECCKEV